MAAGDRARSGRHLRPGAPDHRLDRGRGADPRRQRAARQPPGGRSGEWRLAPVAGPGRRSRARPVPDAGRGRFVTGRPARVLPLRPPSRAAQAAGLGLEALHLGKGYRGRQVLRDVSLHVGRGEAVGLLGPNGAGKTTSFYIITGLIQADTGSIVLDGRDVTALPMYRRARLGLGYLPQEASIFRGLTVEGNLRAVLEVVEPDAAEREAQLDQLLSEFALGHLRRAPAPALSGGERRRVEIARALAARPTIMLLDEPLAGIDPINVAEIRNLVAHLKDRGIGVLITDHNVRDTLGIIDRAYILHDGRVLKEGRPDDIVSDSDVRRVYLGESFQV
ncbi:MAG: LPS export ABC transporter ATP-binding protein [Geminicoccaceae bacterium]|nr:MAG: LPS export ABC transporter ATP-binding protein [Geminicoccaceae bacterium]